MRGLGGGKRVTGDVTAVTGADAAGIAGPCAIPSELTEAQRAAVDRLKAQRERYAREQQDRAMRLRRPAKDEARANVADSHVDRVVVDGRSLRFGYGIDSAIAKGYLPMACARAAERFRRDWELASSGGAIAIIDPTRVRVDQSVRNYESQGGRIGNSEPFDRAIAALGGAKAAPAILAFRCIAEGKTVEVATGELRTLKLCNDVKIARGMLWAAAISLRVHYGY